MTPSQRILAITGMHRSGTSLAASWLERCGLDLGDEYFEPTYGNPRGHFEDLLFVGFHKQVLTRQGVKFVIEPGKELNVSAEETREVYAMLREMGGRPQWGWKDPRTSLFLDFWRARLLQLRVLALYRPFNSVVYSLMRRDLLQPAGPLKKALLPLWHHPANRLLANRYLGTWMRYNSALLRHAEQYPEEVLLVRADGLAADSPAIFEHLINNWGFHLSPVSITSVLVPEEFKQDIPTIQYNNKLHQEAERIWQQLEAYRFIGPQSSIKFPVSVNPSISVGISGISPGSSGQ